MPSEEVWVISAANRTVVSVLDSCNVNIDMFLLERLDL